MREPSLFSYASADDPPLRRIAIKAIERLTGQRRLKRMYLENQRNPRRGENFWDAAVRRLELRVDYDEARLRAIPALGPVVIVANHPFGVLDGIVVSYLLAKIRTDFKVLTHSLLCRASELQPYLLPIDFAPTPAAQAINLRTRADALSWLRGGGALVVFPGGAVATSERMLARRAVDPEWKLFTAKALARAQATVVPIFFEGQKSRLFQLASHISLTLRLSLLFNEGRNKIGSRVAVRIGAPIPYAELSPIADRRPWPNISGARPMSSEAAMISRCPARFRGRAGSGAPCSARRAGAWRKACAGADGVTRAALERGGRRCAGRGTVE